VCGINGILNFKNTPPRETIVCMNKQLAHRGPDNDGIYTDNYIALGHRRLSIIDLSDAGNQPYFSIDNRFVIVYNGELYNYLELKKELSEFNFKSNTDTEVILNSFIKYGADCLQKFNGMYAFAVWDKQKQELFIARDCMGVKPLYYTFINDNFIFSSEVRSIISSNLIAKRIDEFALNQYIQFQTVYAPNTIIKGVKMLMPAHYTIINKNGQNTYKYRQIENYAEKKTNDSYQQACEKTKILLQQSVKRRLISDVPFGAFLSGGIDSTAVVALMSQASNKTVNTFSITFNEKDYTEEKYSQLVAKKYNTAHHEIKLSVNDFKNLLPEALRATDHPSGDGVNTYVVSKYTKQAGITMALSGIGGDELFAGYDVFKRLTKLYSYHFLQNIPVTVRTSVAEILKKIKPGMQSHKLAWLLNKNKWDYTTLYQFNRKLYDESEVNSILSLKPLQAYFLDLENDFNKNKLISSISISEYKTYLQNVLLRDTDQMSMASALEVREPFMDYELIEYVLSLPDNYKLNTQPKKLLIDSLGDLIPNEIYNRSKMGFVFPWKYWLQNDLKLFCEERLYALSKRNYFNKQAIIQLWQRFLNNDPVITWSRIWHLVVLEDWLMQNRIN